MGAIWRQHDHVESILELQWNNDVEMWACAVEDDEDFFINRYTWSQDDHQLIDESLEGGARDRSLFNNVMKQTHVGRYGKRDANVSSAWSYDATDSFAYWCTAFASVKMLNPDSSMYTWRWWTPVKERIDDVAQTGKCEYWPRLTNHVTYWKRCSIVLIRFLL